MRCGLVFVLLFLGCASNLLSADKTWVGGVSSNWFDGGNWSPAGVPDPSHAVQITNFNTVIVTCGVFVASLELRRGTLVVSNQLTVTNLFISESGRINAWQVRPSPVVAPPPGHGVVEVPDGGRLQFGPSPLGASVSAAFEGTRLNLRGYGIGTNRATVLMFFRSELNIYGMLTLTSEFNFDGANGPPAGSVNNYGVLLRSGGTNLNFGVVPFTNRALVRLDSGTMNLGSGANSGVMDISLNATQAFAGTPFTWEAGGRFAALGTARFVRGQFDPGTNDVIIPQFHWVGTELRGTNTYVIQNGLWEAGVVAGAGELHVASGGSLSVRTSNQKWLQRRLVNFGDLSLSTNAGIHFMSSTASLINRGALELGPGAGLFAIEPAAPPLSKFVLNDGLLTSRSGSANHITVRFTNANRFRVEGQVSLFHHVSVQSAGATTVDGTLVTPASGPYFVRGGVLDGNGVVRGRVRNAGTIAPGTSIGQLTIDGSLTNGGIIEIELGLDGSSPIGDQLVVSGHLRLGGRVDVYYRANTWPAESASWEILRFGSLSNAYHEITGLDLGGGRVLQPVWSPTNLVLTLMHQPADTNRLQPVLRGENQLELRFTTEPETTWSLDVSSNLVDWTSLLTTNSPDGVLYFRDFMNLPRRFYRARQLP